MKPESWSRIRSLVWAFVSISSWVSFLVAFWLSILEELSPWYWAITLIIALISFAAGNEKRNAFRE